MLFLFLILLRMTPGSYEATGGPKKPRQVVT